MLLYRLIPLFLLFFATGLFFCHPTPFREPEYLQKRERMLHRDDNFSFPDVSLTGDFDGDSIRDSAYVAVSHEPGNEGKVCLRFNHLLPSLNLADNYTGVRYMECVNNIDNDGACEIYFVGVIQGSCDGMGFFYRLRSGKWKKICEVPLDACSNANNWRGSVENKGNGKYSITYEDKYGDYKTLNGKIQ